MSSATCEVVWLRRILEDIGEKKMEPTKVHCDNQSAVKLAHNLFIMQGQNTLSCNTTLSEKRLSLRKLNLFIVTQVIMSPTYLPNLLARFTLRSLGKN